MITEINEKNLKEAAFVYMCSWKESHRKICSEEFIKKHDASYMINYLSEKIKNAYKIYIKYSDDVPVGIVGLNPCDEEICLLYVLPEMQGKGFGSELLEFAVAKCKNPYITVLDTNKRAIEFYSRRGFAPAEIQPENNGEKKIFERKYVYQKRNL